MTDVVLAEERYSYVLFRRAEEHLLTYLSGGPIGVVGTVGLSPELASDLSKSSEQLRALVQSLLSSHFPPGVVRLPSSTWPAS